MPPRGYETAPEMLVRGSQAALNRFYTPEVDATQRHRVGRSAISTRVPHWPTLATVNAMVFDARVIQVLVASPSDVGSARAILREAVEDWNSLNGEDRGQLLLARMWERDSTPELGAPP